MLLQDLIGILQNRPPSRRVPPDFFCHSCREVSRKAERFLNDPSLYKEAEKISGEVCHITRSDLQVKVPSDRLQFSGVNRFFVSSGNRFLRYHL